MRRRPGQNLAPLGRRNLVVVVVEGWVAVASARRTLGQALEAPQGLGAAERRTSDRPARRTLARRVPGREGPVAPRLARQRGPAVARRPAALRGARAAPRTRRRPSSR